MKTQVFVEGGAQGRPARHLRIAFGSFMAKAGVSRQHFQVIACGSRGDAYNKFSGEVRKGLPAILLVDAEMPVADQRPWQHLRRSDNWDRPNGATDDQCHLMVQIMESWFLADADNVESYYGSGFRRQALSRNPDVEQVPKQDVRSGLDRATRQTPKGSYSKGKHAFELLERIDPAKVRAASHYADRFINALTT